MNNQEVTLLTPGPTPIHPRALAAFYWPMRSHMDPDVFAYNDQIVRIFRFESFQIGDDVDTVDATVSPKIKQHDFAAQRGKR